MKYLIVGLGNIGAEYAETRHNIGFKVADALAAEAGAVFATGRYGSVAEFRHKGRTFVLLKPSTYMNLSGKAVSYWLKAEKIPQENLLVVSTTSRCRSARSVSGPKAATADTTGSKASPSCSATATMRGFASVSGATSPKAFR